MLQFIEVNPKISPKSSVIWLHGLGASGHDFEDIVPQLKLPQELATRFIFPHAPMRKVTWAGNMKMRAWFNIIKLERSLEDADGIRSSQALVDELIQNEMARGVSSEKIVVGGFSQGGAMALQCGLRFKEKLAGILALSAWLPLIDSLAAEKTAANQKTPILMQHGTCDDLVPLAWAKQSYDHLSNSNYNVRLDTYPMQHNLCDAEIATVAKWLAGILVKGIE
jgi:phospholipase/carboxylesterase